MGLSVFCPTDQRGKTGSKTERYRNQEKKRKQKRNENWKERLWEKGEVESDTNHFKYYPTKRALNYRKGKK